MSSDESSSTDSRPTSVIIQEMTNLCRQRKGDNYLPNIRRIESKSSSCELCSRGSHCLGPSCLGKKTRPSIFRQVMPFAGPTSIIPGSMGDKSSSLMEISKTPTSGISKVPGSADISRMFRKGPLQENKQGKFQSSVGPMKEPVHNNNKVQVVGGPAVNYDPVKLRKILLKSTVSQRSSEIQIKDKVMAVNVAKPTPKSSSERKLATCEKSCSRKDTIKEDTPAKVKPSSSGNSSNMAFNIATYPELLYHSFASGAGINEFKRKQNYKEFDENPGHKFIVSSWGHIIWGLRGGSPLPKLQESPTPMILDEEFSTIGDSFDEEMEITNDQPFSTSLPPILVEEYSEIGDSFDDSEHDGERSADKNGQIDNSNDQVPSSSMCLLLDEESTIGDSFDDNLEDDQECNGKGNVSKNRFDAKALSDFDAFEFVDEDEFIGSYAPKFAISDPTAPKVSCCDQSCNVQSFSINVKSRLEEIIRNKSEIKQKLLDQLYAQDNLCVSTSGFIIGGQFLCKKYICEYSKVSPYMVKEVFKAFAAGQKVFIHGNITEMKQSPAVTGFICWVKNFATNFGNFAPDDQVIVISACFTVKEIYLMYKLQAPEPQVAKSSFYALFNSKFGRKREDLSLPCVRISSYSSHSRCDQCLLLERYQRSSQSPEDFDMASRLKQEHKQTFVRARIAIEEKRLISLSDPKQHIFLQVDDMDNHKV